MGHKDLRERVDAISRGLRRVADNLTKLGYVFSRPDSVLPGPENGTDAAIDRIGREVGEVPLGLQLFWTRIGSVDFSGHHPDWLGCEYPDPVLVYPASVAVNELDEFLSDIEEATKFGGRYVIPIAPDSFHKANVSGGMWYNIDVPAVADDPPLNEEPHATTLLSYLELAIHIGGFPGLEGSPGHDWPIERITEGL